MGLLPSTTYMHHWIGTSLVQIMACHLIGAKPFFKPMMTFHQSHPNEQNSMQRLSKIPIFMGKITVEFIGCIFCTILFRSRWVIIHDVQVAWLITEVTPSHYVGLTLNTLRPRQSWRHFADAIFKCLFLNENIWISLNISLKFVPTVGINNMPALVQIMAWHQTCD